MYGDEYLDLLDTGFHAEWDPKITKSAYCTWTITQYVTWYNSAGLIIGRAAQDVLQETSKSTPTNLGENYPFGYIKYIALNYKPFGATSAVCKYVLTVVVADGVNVYAIKTKTSVVQIVSF